MKVAVSSVITRPINANTHGGTESFTYILVNELVKRGHEVHLYGASDCETPAILHSWIDSRTAREKPMNEKVSLPYYMLYAQKMIEDADQYDIIHNNFFHYYLLGAFNAYITTPIVHTIHNAFFQNQQWKDALDQFKKGEREYFVFVSEQARQLAGMSSNASVIHHGIDKNEFTFSEKSADNFLWLGRMMPEKGAADAARACRETESKLILNTAKNAQIDPLYFEKEVVPLLSDHIHMLQKETHEEKERLFQEAKALLFPIAWEEPFGLVMLEAMASGTPILGYARGSVPEIIKDGETGYLINASEEHKRGDFIIQETGQKGLQEAIQRISALSSEEYAQMRLASRQRVESHFSVTKMIDEYEQLYKNLTMK